PEDTAGATGKTGIDIRGIHCRIATRAPDLPHVAGAARTSGAAHPTHQPDESHHDPPIGEPDSDGAAVGSRVPDGPCERPLRNLRVDRRRDLSGRPGRAARRYTPAKLPCPR